MEVYQYILPSEIWDLIVSYLTYKEAIKLGTVSRYLSEIIFNNSKIHQDFLDSEFNYGLALSDKLPTDDSIILREKLFAKLCRCEYYELTRWATKKLNITKEDINEPLYTAFISNNFITIKWIMTEFDIEKEDISEKCWKKIARYCHLKSLKYFIEKINIKPIDPDQEGLTIGDLIENKKYNNFFRKAIITACSCGEIKIIKFLLEKWPFLRKQIRKEDINSGLRSFYDNPRPNRAFDKFKTFIELLNINRGQILEQIVRIFTRENVANVEDFIDRYKITKEEFFEYYDLINMLGPEKPENLEFLIRKYNLNHETSSEDIKDLNRQCMEAACTTFGELVERGRTFYNTRDDKFYRFILILTRDLGIKSEGSSFMLDIGEEDNLFSAITDSIISNEVEDDIRWKNINNTLKVLLKDFNISRDEFKEICDEDYYIRKIHFVKGGEKLSKYGKYRKWLNSV